MKKILLAGKIKQKIDDVIDELNELDRDQHPKYYKNQPGERKRTAFLLLKLNEMEKKLSEVRR